MSFIKGMISSSFNKALFAYQSKAGDDWELAGKALIEFVSFRYTSGSDSFVSVVWPVFKGVVRSIIKSDKTNRFEKFNAGSHIAVLDNSFKHIGLRKKYLAEILKAEPDYLFCKSNLIIATGFGHKISLLAIAFKWFFKLLLMKKDPRYLVNYALITKEVIEINCQIKWLKKLKIKALYDFANYEVDSNVLYLILKEENITVCKIPSAGPLINHNSILLTDTLVVSSGYHLEELRYLQNIKYKHLVKAIPEMAQSFMDRYKIVSDSVNEENLMRIGYYSHASWLRAKNNHADNGLNILKGEVDTLKIIASFLRKNRNFKLTLYLHPKEKKQNLLSETKEFYDSILEKCEYEYAPFELKTTESFDYVNIAVVSLSTIIFERLFAGKKLLICKKNLSNFPHEDSSLNNICFEDDLRLEELVNANFKLTDREFFMKNGLEIHLQTNFPGVG